MKKKLWNFGEEEGGELLSDEYLWKKSEFSEKL